MATEYAHRVRQRALLLPWNFDWTGLKPYAHRSVAFEACWQLLRPIDHFPAEHWHRRYGPACCHHCYLCKNPNLPIGLHYSCSECVEHPDRNSPEYYHCYIATLEVAHAVWTHQL